MSHYFSLFFGDESGKIFYPKNKVENAKKRKKTSAKLKTVKYTFFIEINEGSIILYILIYGTTSCVLSFNKSKVLNLKILNFCMLALHDSMRACNAMHALMAIQYYTHPIYMMSQIYLSYTVDIPLTLGRQ